MQEQLARLEEIATHLATSSDSLAEAISRLEEKLASFRLGVSAFVGEPLETEPIADDQGQRDGMPVKNSFSYLKVNRAGRLVICKLTDMSSDLVEVPLLQAPREIRVKAVQQLPSLLGELEKNAGAAFQDVQRVLNELNFLVYS